MGEFLHIIQLGNGDGCSKVIRKSYTRKMHRELNHVIQTSRHHQKQCNSINFLGKYITKGSANAGFQIKLINKVLKVISRFRKMALLYNRIMSVDKNLVSSSVLLPQSVIAVLLLCKYQYLLDAALQILQLMYIDVSTLYQNGS